MAVVNLANILTFYVSRYEFLFSVIVYLSIAEILQLAGVRSFQSLTLVLSVPDAHQAPSQGRLIGIR